MVRERFGYEIQAIWEASIMAIDRACDCDSRDMVGRTGKGLGGLVKR
jgi:hypothetical protein